MYANVTFDFPSSALEDDVEQEVFGEGAGAVGVKGSNAAFTWIGLTLTQTLQVVYYGVLQAHLPTGKSNHQKS